jgi:hypothetical protein
VLVATAIAGVVKYYREKNRDFYEKILNGVYAPIVSVYSQARIC